MARSLSSTADASLTAEATSEVWLALLTLEHEDLAEPLRFVNNDESITSGGDLYIPAPFEVELPGQDAESPGEARLRVDNIDREIVETLRTIQSPIEVTIEVILASAPNTIEISIPQLSLRDVEWDALQVRGTLRFEDILGEPVSVAMTPERFPGLF